MGYYGLSQVLVIDQLHEIRLNKAFLVNGHFFWFSKLLLTRFHSDKLSCENYKFNQELRFLLSPCDPQRFCEVGDNPCWAFKTYKVRLPFSETCRCGFSQRNHKLLCAVFLMYSKGINCITFAVNRLHTSNNQYLTCECRRFSIHRFSEQLEICLHS